MTKRSKLIAQFLAKPPEVDFDDVRQLLEMFGYEMRGRGSGSHRVFTRPGCNAITFPVVGGRRVKRTYVHLIIDYLDLENYRENEDATR